MYWPCQRGYHFGEVSRACAWHGRGINKVAIVIGLGWQVSLLAQSTTVTMVPEMGLPEGSRVCTCVELRPQYKSAHLTTQREGVEETVNVLTELFDSQCCTTATWRSEQAVCTGLANGFPLGIFQV